MREDLYCVDFLISPSRLKKKKKMSEPTLLNSNSEYICINDYMEYLITREMWKQQNTDRSAIVDHLLDSASTNSTVQECTIGE